MPRADISVGTKGDPGPTTRLPFAGRDNELRALSATIAAGDSVALIVGPAGVGKTRLVDETVAALGNAHVLVGRCWEAGPAHPLLPWLQIAAQAADILDPESVEPRLRGLADLGVLFPHLNSQRQFADAENQLHVLVLAVAEYLERVAAAQHDQVVVVIEDIHRADPMSVSLLHWLGAQQSSVSFVATTRPFGEANATVSSAAEVLAGGSAVLRLSRLGRQAVVEILEAIDLQNRSEDAYAASGGIPLLLHDWVRATEAGQDGTLTGLEQRIAQLPSDCLDVMAVAAAVGDEFDVGIVAEAMNSDLLTVLTSIRPAIEAGLVQPVEGSDVFHRFQHSTYREAFDRHEDIATSARIHGRICSALEKRFGGDPTGLTALASHASIASLDGDFDRAIDLNVRAAQHAMSQAAPDVAEFHYSRALEFATMAGSSQKERGEITVGLARAQQSLGSPQLRNTVQRATELAEAIGDDDLLARAVLALPPPIGPLGLETDPKAETAVLLKRALGRLSREPTVTRARLLVETATQQFANLTLDEVDELVDEARSIAYQLDSPELEALVTVARDVAYRPPIDLSAKVTELAAIEARLGSTAPETRLALAALRVTTLMRDGRLEDVRRVIEHVESMFGHAPKVAQWATHRWRAALAHATADMDAAETFVRKSMQVAAGTRRASSVAEFSAILLGYVMRERRTQSTGLPIMRGWVENRPNYLPYRAALAWILADMGDVDGAETHLTRVFESDLSKHRQAAEWLPLVTMAGMAAATIDKAEWASIVVDLIEPHRDEWVVVGTGVAVDGPVALRRGFMAAAAGQLDIARADIEHGEAAARSAGAHTFVIMAQSYRAHLETLEGRPDVAATSYLAAADLSKAHRLDAWSDELRGKAAALMSEQPVPLASAVDTVESRVGRFVKVGKVWQVQLGDSATTVADMKGMPMLLELLRSPNTDIHVRELSVVADGTSRGSSNEANLPVRGGWGNDPVLDDRAIQSYRERVLDLQQTMDDAHEDNDLERVAIAEAELDALLDELKRSSGLRGRVRALDKSSERTRVRVTKALRTALRRINDASPMIGGHLQTSVQTGTFCAYRPDPSLRIVWEL